MKRVVLVVITVSFVASALYFASPRTSGKGGKLFRSENSIPGKYIVVLEPDAEFRLSDRRSIESAVTELAGEYNAGVTAVYDAALQGFAAEMSPEDAALLSRDDRVRFVEEDSVTFVSGVQTSSDWGLDRIDQRDLPLNGAFMYSQTGNGVNAYVIDSGIRVTHAEFGGRASVAFDAVNDGQNGNDCHGHGTHVAGTIGSTTYGVAKNVNLRAVRVLPCSGFGSVSAMINGINWVTANRIEPAVVNMSVYVSTISNSLNTAINNSVASGVPYIVAAGNNGNDACLYSPASASGALAVGATGSDDARASYSNFGSCVDIFAPGTGITSLSHLSDSGIRTMSGTSMAAPMVAGAAALFLEAEPNASPATVSNRIRLDATSGAVTNIDTVSPNKLLYSWLGDTQPPTPATVTIIKEVQTFGGGTASTTSFSFSATNLGTPGFSLVDNDLEPADRFTNSSVFLFDEPNTITVTEAALEGWSLTSIQCIESPGEGLPNTQNSTIDLQNRRANIVVEQGENVTCMFRSEQLAPTSGPGSVTGRVVDANGFGVRGATVKLLHMLTGEEISTVTNSFGYYSFSDLEVAAFYVVMVSESKRYTFQPNDRAFTLDGDLFDVDFVAIPRSE